MRNLISKAATSLLALASIAAGRPPVSAPSASPQSRAAPAANVVPVTEQLKCPFAAWSEDMRATFFVQSSQMRQNPQAVSPLPPSIKARMDEVVRTCSDHFRWSATQAMAAANYANNEGFVAATRSMLQSERLPVDLVEQSVAALTEAEKDQFLVGQAPRRLFDLVFKRITAARPDLANAPWPNARQVGRGVGASALSLVLNERFARHFTSPDKLAEFAASRARIAAQINRQGTTTGQ